MSRAKGALPDGATRHGPRYSFFCYAGRQPLMEVMTGADNADRQERAILLIKSIEEVMERACIRGAEHGDDEALDTSTAYLVRFAADAAEALVHSLDVKE